MAALVNYFPLQLYVSKRYLLYYFMDQGQTDSDQLT